MFINQNIVGKPLGISAYVKWESGSTPSDRSMERVKNVLDNVTLPTVRG